MAKKMCFCIGKEEFGIGPCASITSGGTFCACSTSRASVDASTSTWTRSHFEVVQGFGMDGMLKVNKGTFKKKHCLSTN